MKYEPGDIVIINNDYLCQTLSSGDKYNNIAIIRDFYYNEKDSFHLIISRNDSDTYTFGAMIKEDGILQLFPSNVNIKYTHLRAGAEKECYINNNRKLIDSLTGKKLDYMNLDDFRITSSYEIKQQQKQEDIINNNLLNDIYDCLGE